MTRILCIEDETALREDIVEEFSDAGYETLAAENGEVGYRAILDHRPDLVLCDINMPDMNGHELLTRLRTEHAELGDMPFVFLSALADRRDIIAGKKLGADDYLTKPVDFEMLLATVESRLGQIVRINRYKEEQLVRLYRALSGTPAPEAGNAAASQASGTPAADGMTVAAVIDTEFDMSALTVALEADGHKVVTLNSGKQFLYSANSIAPDILLASFNTADIQAPMLVRLLRDASFPKVLLIPPSMAEMDRLDEIPGFDTTIHWPCEPGELRDRIAVLQSRAAS